MLGYVNIGRLSGLKDDRKSRIALKVANASEAMSKVDTSTYLKKS